MEKGESIKISNTGLTWKQSPVPWPRWVSCLPCVLVSTLTVWSIHLHRITMRTPELKFKAAYLRACHTKFSINLIFISRY